MSSSNTNTTQTLITDYFHPVKVYGYNPKTNSFHCCECGEDMGPENPRQLCRKTYCGNYDNFLQLNQ